MLADLCFDLFVDLEGTCAVWPSKSELFHQVKSCLVLSNYWRRNAEQLTVQHSRVMGQDLFFFCEAQL